MALNKPTEGRTFVSFKPSIGMLAIKSDENDVEAKPRTYKDPQSGEEKTVYERQYKSLDGKIVGIEVDTAGDYGPQLKLTIRDTEDVVFAVPLDKGWGQKIAEAVPNINLDETVYITAYGDFTTEDGSEVKAGVSIKQNGEKVPSKFKSYDADKKEWSNFEGYPEVDKEAMPEKTQKVKWTKFWSDYNYAVTDFLSEYLQKNHTLEVTPAEPVEEAEPEEVKPPF
jgi:hypothetical protein